MIRDFIGDRIQSGVLFDGTYGIEIETESKLFYDPPKMKFWSAKHDGSLRDVGFEYILKVPLRWGKELDDGLAEFGEKTKGIPFIEDSNSTSVHVHVNMLPETWKTMGNFLTLYTLVESILIEISGEFRRNNLFCLPIRSVPYVVTIMKEIFTNVSRRNYGFNKQMGNEREQNAIKYAALNLGTLIRFGSVEIRSFRGVTDPGVILGWVSIINKMLEHARMDTNPVEIMESYHKKDMRFLKDVFKDDWDQIKYDNMKELIEQNLWAAGDFGYNFSTEQWAKMDVKPDKKIQKKREQWILDKYAIDMFGVPFARIGQFDKDMINEIYDNDEQKGALPKRAEPENHIAFEHLPQPEVVAAPPADWLDHFRVAQPVVAAADVAQPANAPRRRRRAQVNVVNPEE